MRLEDGANFLGRDPPEILNPLLRRLVRSPPSLHKENSEEGSIVAKLIFVAREGAVLLLLQCLEGANQQWDDGGSESALTHLIELPLIAGPRGGLATGQLRYRKGFRILPCPVSGEVPGRGSRAS